MSDFAPAPWPLEIRDWFVHGPVPTEVPAFLHPLLIGWTAVLSASEPDFRYKDIHVRRDGEVLINLEDEDIYDDGFQETLEYMMRELTLAYSLKEDSND